MAHRDSAKSVGARLRLTPARQLKRRYVLAFFEKLQPCLVGIEACASSHHWSRELQALGHTVRLMPPAYVKKNLPIGSQLLGLDRAGSQTALERGSG